MLGRLDHSLDTEVKGKTEAKKKKPQKKHQDCKIIFLEFGRQEVVGAAYQNGD